MVMSGELELRYPNILRRGSVAFSMTSRSEWHYFPCHSSTPVAYGMHVHYCCCDVYLGSVIDVSDVGGAHTLSDTTKEEWEANFVPSSSASHRDPNQAPTEIAPSTPVPPDEETPCIPETPKFDPDSRGAPPDEPAIGVATKIEASDGRCQSNTSIAFKTYPRLP